MPNVLTTDSFKDVGGPRVFAAVKDGASYEWAGQEESVSKSLGEEGLILVCAKNAVNLPEVIRFLAQMDAATYPVLILDDEADAATPDTTVEARASGRSNAPEQPSRINRLVFENEDPSEEGFSLGEHLPHALYVQVTATPFVLFLQPADAKIRPTDVMLLEPGAGYCGGEAFFGTYDPDDSEAPLPNTLVLVDANEATVVKRAAPEGLARSIDFFVLSACAVAMRTGWQGGFLHLSHTSHRTDEHELVAGYIAARLNELRTLLRGTDAEAEIFFADAYKELLRSVADAPSLTDLIAASRSALQHTEVHKINSRAEPPTYGPRLNFIVGGNILGRGLTISNLLVTYYVREAKTSQMDTVWQHARMYGYRASYLQFVRIYLPPQLAARFAQIHDAEAALRRTLALGLDPSQILIRVPRSSRPTRPNALDPNAIRVVKAGRAQINPRQVKDDPLSAANVVQMLIDAGVALGDSDRLKDGTVRLPLQTALELVDAVPVHEDDAGAWDPDMICALIKNYSEKLHDGMMLYVRPLVIETGERTRARLAGHEIDNIRKASPDAPALVLLHRGPSEAPQAWYPTIVMPEGSPDYVFSGG